MIKKNIGCLCENIAICWLQEQNYFVYKGCQTQSAIDLIAVDPKTLETILIDVKIVSRRKSGTEIGRMARVDNKRIFILKVDLKTKKCRIVKKRLLWTTKKLKHA
jgi:Holliday junction resolvase-like predicted endonuclease